MELKDIIEDLQKKNRKDLYGIEDNNTATPNLDRMVAETAQIVAREVVKIVEEIEVTGDCPINEALHMNTMKQFILSQLRADLQSLEEELTK